FILGERLRPLQWGAMAVAGTAVAVLALDYGRLPWVALVLAFSFGTYGLAKKSANVGSVESLTLETALIAPFAAAYAVPLVPPGTALIAPFAAAYVGLLMATGHSNFGSHGAGHALWLCSAGIVTAIPL